MNTFLKHMGSAIVVAASWLWLSGVAVAAGDMTITRFDADLTLSNTDKQGQLHIVETIDMEFLVPKHGLLRAIPEKYQGQSLELSVNKVTSPSGAPSGFELESNNDNIVLRIGDANQTITGKQTYVIDYTVSNVVRWFDGRPELYWDINGDQWPAATQAVQAVLHLPGSAGLSRCYTGKYGQTEAACTIENNGNNVKVATTAPLQDYETLTLVTQLPDGYFVAPTWRDWLAERAAELAVAMAIFGFVGGWAWRKWWREGRDLKGRGIIVPEYDAPKGISPAEAGVIDGYRLESRDLTATLIDLAIRKYVKIHEETKRQLIGSTQTYHFELLKSDWASLNDSERQILTALFEDKTAGTVVDDLAGRRTELAQVFRDLGSSLPKDLTTRGYFPANPMTSGGWLWAVGIVLGVAAFFVANVLSWVAAACAVTAAVTFALAALMPKRTNSGVTAREHIQGLKLYLDTAEKDRLKMMQSVTRRYARSAGEAPVRTVELFEKLLPYAIVLGVEDSWAKQFADIYTQEPDWYAGNWTTFNAMALTHSLNGAVGAMNTNFTPPSSSSSSGFGGGGFSGGGGGGGGGGSW